LKFNVEEKATQRGASAYTTWSVEKCGVRERAFPYGEEEIYVVDFQALNLLIYDLWREAYAVLTRGMMPLS